MTKIAILDSSTLINLAMNGLLDILPSIKKMFNIKFIITRQIKYEVIDKPLNIKRFHLGALMIKKLFDEIIIELPSSIKLKDEEIQARSREILRVMNNVFYANDRKMNIIHDGEASCIAVSMILNERNIKNIIVIDERSTRMLIEKPDNLHKLFEKKLHQPIQYNKKSLGSFSDIRFIRSSELVYIAQKNNLIDLHDGNVLEALLYAVKFKGCTISIEEINEALRA